MLSAYVAMQLPRFYQSSIQFKDMPEDAGIRTHWKITALFLKCCCQIVELHTKEYGTIYLNKCSFDRWKVRHKVDRMSHSDALTVIRTVVFGKKSQRFWAELWPLPAIEALEIVENGLGRQTNLQNFQTLKKWIRAEFIGGMGAFWFLGITFQWRLKQMKEKAEAAKKSFGMPDCIKTSGLIDQCLAIIEKLHRKQTLSAEDNAWLQANEVSLPSDATMVALLDKFSEGSMEHTIASESYQMFKDEALSDSLLKLLDSFEMRFSAEKLTNTMFRQLVGAHPEVLKVDSDIALENSVVEALAQAKFKLLKAAGEQYEHSNQVNALCERVNKLDQFYNNFVKNKSVLGKGFLKEIEGLQRETHLQCWEIDAKEWAALDDPAHKSERVRSELLAKRFILAKILEEIHALHHSHLESMIASKQLESKADLLLEKLNFADALPKLLESINKAQPFTQAYQRLQQKHAVAKEFHDFAQKLSAFGKLEEFEKVFQEANKRLLATMQAHKKELEGTETSRNINAQLGTIESSLKSVSDSSILSTAFSDVILMEVRVQLVRFEKYKDAIETCNRLQSLLPRN